MNKLGQYLTEIIFEFRPSTIITIKEVELFLDKVIETIKVKQTHRHINTLFPGFDILCGLKESCLYFGYWPEHSYVRFMVSSCKRYDKNEVEEDIKKYFKIKDTIYMKTNCNCSIKDKVGDLWC